MQYPDDESQFYIPENLIAGSEEAHTSPSNKYLLKTASYKTLTGYGSISKAEVFLSNGTERLFEVKRNYGQFYFSFVEAHPNGHDYLVCGEDYQGQTILELDTGKKVDHVAEGAKNGVGWCWAQINPSLEKDLLAVDGCFWGASYDLRIIDFTEPMKPPFLVWSEINGIREDTAFSKLWSSSSQVEVERYNEETETLEKVIWKKPSLEEVIAKSEKELEKEKARSTHYFVPDLEIQVSLARERMSNTTTALKQLDI